jgi:hypothetical protein
MRINGLGIQILNSMASLANSFLRHSQRRSIIIGSLFILVVFLGSSTIANPPPSAYAQSSSSLQPVFSTPINLSNDNGRAANPDIWNVGSNVYVAWSEGAKGLMFRESPNGGTTWYPPLTSPALDIATSSGNTAPLLSANGSNVYVVWSETIGSGVAQIMEATSVNNGLNFSAPVQVSTGSAAALTPVIASWGNYVYVAWTSGADSYLSCSSNAGAQNSWTTPWEYGYAHEPQLAAWGGQYVYAVSDDSLWVSNNNCQPYSWRQERYSLGSEPWIWAYGPNVYAAGEGKGTSSRITIQVSNDYGQYWNTATLSTTFNDTWAPMVYAYGNSAWIAVHTNPGGSLSEVYMYTTTNAGASWSAPILLSTPPKDGSDTSFPFTVKTSDGENVFVAWSQQKTPGYWQLYASYSANGGLNWTASPGIDVSQNPNGTEASNNNDLANAAITSYGTSCYAVWQYIVGTKNQVYFSASTLGVVTPPASLSVIPVRGSVGTNTTVTGSYFLPSSTVSIELGGAPRMSAMSNSAGNFTATFAMPNATAGSHTVTATDGKNTLSSTFNVVSKITEKPVSGPPAKAVSLAGSGFAADSNVAVYFNGTQVASATTSSSGSFGSNYIVPSLAAGKYTVEAIDAQGDSATATFTIN